MSNPNTEIIAVHAIVNETFQPGQHLVARIPTDDKEPSFDGYITVHNDASKTVNSFMYNVPTQVKGTEVDEFSDSSRSFPLEIADYQNYYKQGGCLLLVVEVLKTNVNATKIFYKHLLPIDLKEIINIHGKQKTHAVKLRPLEETSLYSVCVIMDDQMHKQSTYLIESNQYKDEEFEQHIFTSLTFDPERDAPSDIMKHDFIHFGLKDNIEYPLRRSRIEGIGVKYLQKVVAGDEEYMFNVQTSYTPPIYRWVIEDSLTFMKNEKTENKLTYSLVPKSLQSILKIYPFLINFLSSGKIRFDDLYAEFDKEEQVEVLNQVNQAHDFFELAGMTFDRLGISHELEFNGTFEEIVKKLEFLQDIFVNKNYEGINIQNPDKPSYCNVTIGDVTILMFYNPNSKKEKFLNVFDEKFLDLDWTYKNNETGKLANISPYLLINKDAFVKAANIDFNLIKQSLLQIEFIEDFVFGPVNNFILNCINAFDETNRTEFLQLAHDLMHDRKKEFAEESNYVVSELNALQISYRMNRELNTEQFQRLLKLKDNAASLSNKVELMYGVSVLSESLREAEFYFEQFDDERKSYYKTLPIYKLYSDLKKGSHN
ncbi:hypothetical protein SAMN04489762_1261 [Terribacillus saccharophilus]|uniref:Uncharacterized protein n=1 Tax=Terribacillus saccharophilus TaxID=361277 RepID=A0AAX2EDQ5_9BACI|nr:hypothetical protein SAMN04489762_1261 [Terribacillus saccharophilus]